MYRAREFMYPTQAYVHLVAVSGSSPSLHVPPRRPPKLLLKYGVPDCGLGIADPRRLSPLSSSGRCRGDDGFHSRSAEQKEKRVEGLVLVHDKTTMRERDRNMKNRRHAELQILVACQQLTFRLPPCGRPRLTSYVIW